MTVETIDAQQLKKKVKLFEAIVNRTQDGILVFNHLGEVIYGNASAGQLLGLAPEKLRGKHLSTFIQKDQHQKHEKLVSLFTASTQTEQKMQDWTSVNCQRIDGTLFPVNLVVHKYTISESVVFIVSLRDMTEIEKVQQEQKIAELKLFQMEQQVKCSSKTLQIKMEKVLKKIAQKAQSVKDTSGNRYIDQQMGTILQNVFQAVGISQNAAYYTTPHDINSDQFSFIDHSIYGSFERIRKMLAGELKEKEGTIVWNIPASARELRVENCQKVEQIFYNIIEDAIQNVSSGQIVVQIDQLQIDENQILQINFCCENSNFGIPQQTMDKVLNAPSNKTVPDYTDLSEGGQCLRLAKYMIEDGRGNMRVISHPINGTKIYVQLYEELYNPVNESKDVSQTQTESEQEMILE